MCRTLALFHNTLTSTQSRQSQCPWLPVQGSCALYIILFSCLAWQTYLVAKAKRSKVNRIRAGRRQHGSRVGVPHKPLLCRGIVPKHALQHHTTLHTQPNSSGVFPTHPSRSPTHPANTNTTARVRVFVPTHQEMLQQCGWAIWSQVEPLGQKRALLQQRRVVGPNHHRVQHHALTLGGKDGVHGGDVLTRRIGARLGMLMWSLHGVDRGLTGGWDRMHN